MTHQHCGFSYLLPLGLAACPCTQPRLEGSPAGGSKGKNTRTPLVTYDLLKPDTHGHFIPPPPQESAAITEHNTGPWHLSISTTFLLCSQIHRKSAEVWCDFRVKWWRDRDVVNTMLRLKTHTTTNPQRRGSQTEAILHRSPTAGTGLIPEQPQHTTQHCCPLFSRQTLNTFVQSVPAALHVWELLNYCEASDDESGFSLQQKQTESSYAMLKIVSG